MDNTRTLREAAVTSNLVRLSRTYRRAVNDAALAHGLSDARVLPIIHLSRLGDNVRHGVLAEDMGIEGPSLGRLLDQLCLAGLVDRRDDSADKRAKLLNLTEQGHAMAATVEKLIEDLRHRLLANVSDSDLEATLRVFAALDAAIHPESSHE